MTTARELALQVKIARQLGQIQRREKRIAGLRAEVHRLEVKVRQLVTNCPYREMAEDLVLLLEAKDQDDGTRTSLDEIKRQLAGNGGSPK